MFENNTEENLTMTSPDIAFVCVANTTTPARTFIAVRGADRAGLLRDMFPDTDTEVRFVDFPDLVDLAARELAGGKRGVILGTAADGEWTSWYPPVPAPAVPEAA